MATPAHVLDPMLDLEDEDLHHFDRLVQAENAGLEVDDLLDEAGADARLEADLLASGFYGSPEAVDEDAARDLATRALGDYLVRIREAAVERRWGIDEQTLLNFAFRFGHHYVEVDRGRRAVVPVPAPRDVVRRKANKFEPWYRAQHGNLSRAI